MADRTRTAATMSAPRSVVGAQSWASWPDSASPPQPAPGPVGFQAPFHGVSDEELLESLVPILMAKRDKRILLKDIDWRKIFDDESQLKAFIARNHNRIGGDPVSIWLKDASAGVKAPKRDATSRFAQPSFGRGSRGPQQAAQSTVPPTARSAQQAPPPSATRPSAEPSAQRTQPPPPWRRMSDVPPPSQPPAAATARKFSVDAHEHTRSKWAPPPGHIETGREKFLGYKVARLETKLEKATANLNKFKASYEWLLAQLKCCGKDLTPHLLECTTCTAIACQQCVSRHAPCKTCGSVDTFVPAPALSRIVSSIRLDCPEECGEEVTVGELEHHRSMLCLSAHVPCPFAPACQARPRRRHVQRHLQEEDHSKLIKPPTPPLHPKLHSEREELVGTVEEKKEVGEEEAKEEPLPSMQDAEEEEEEEEINDDEWSTANAGSQQKFGFVSQDRFREDEEEVTHPEMTPQTERPRSYQLPPPVSGHPYNDPRCSIQ